MCTDQLHSETLTKKASFFGSTAMIADRSERSCHYLSACRLDSLCRRLAIVSSAQSVEAKESHQSPSCIRAGSSARRRELPETVIQAGASHVALMSRSTTTTVRD